MSFIYADVAQLVTRPTACLSDDIGQAGGEHQIVDLRVTGSPRGRLFAEGMASQAESGRRCGEFRRGRAESSDVKSGETKI